MNPKVRESESTRSKNFQAYMKETFGAILKSSLKKNGNYSVTVAFKNPLGEDKEMKLDQLLVGQFVKSVATLSPRMRMRIV